MTFPRTSQFDCTPPGTLLNQILMVQNYDLHFIGISNGTRRTRNAILAEEGRGGQETGPGAEHV